MPIFEILLITFVLLFIAMLTATLCRGLPIPYTVLLVLIGIGINIAEPFLPFAAQLHNFHLTPDMVFFVFLPALIFESALALEARLLLKNLAPILMMAIPGMLVSTFLVGLGVWLSIEINLIVALVFGALISATDPVAVIALFKELGVPRRLTVLVEGESLLNDATAIVLFNIMLGFVFSGNITYNDAWPAFTEFCYVFFGGIFIGISIGFIGSELIVRTHHNDKASAIILSLIIAYFSFIISEHYFHTSGVMAVLTSAICLNALGLMRLPHETIHSIHNTWEVIVLICNSLLFILIGLSADVFSVLSNWHSVLLAVVAVALARAVSVYLFAPLATHTFKLPKISFGEQHIMWWGGLKGGLAIAVVLSIPDILTEKALLVELTLGIVLVSLLINATSIRSLIHLLKIDRLSSKEYAELQQHMQEVKRSTDHLLNSFSQMHLLGENVQSSVEIAIAANLKSKHVELSPHQILEQLHLQTLYAEKQELEYLHEIGVVNYYTFVSFMDVLKNDHERDVKQAINIKTDVTQHNILTRVETVIINFLGRHDWLLPLLMKYQNLRFSNRIQHDIAGILMAHKALKVVKNNDFDINKEKLKELQNLYQKRLIRRQTRLKEFSKLYNEFYQNYEYQLFQKVALLYSLRQLAQEYEEGQISTKVYNKLEKRLRKAIKQLPKISIIISSSRKHQWIEKAPLFKGLPTAMLDELAQKTHYVNFLPDDIIFKQHDKGQSLYILVNGRVAVYIENKQGLSVFCTELHEGSFIGEHALLEESKRSATIKAVTYVTLLKLTAKEVLEMAKQFPELEIRLRESDLKRQEADLERQKAELKLTSIQKPKR